jgi:hypothetical protein
MKNIFTAEQREWLTNWLMGHCFTKAQAKRALDRLEAGKWPLSLKDKKAAKFSR